MDKYIMR